MKTRKLDTLGREHGLSGPEAPSEAAQRQSDIIASETDMLQAERRHVRDNRRCDIDALPAGWFLLAMRCFGQ